MGEYYIGPYRDHYAIFNSNGEVEAQYDTHKEAKEDLPEYENMNEGLIGWAILFGALGLTALYSRIDNAIQNRKNKNKPALEAIGITEKEINTISNQIKNLKNDIISKQKSSPLYKNLYQYMKPWNDDKYIDAVTALKSGESLDLGLELRTDVYYAFVEFFDLTNNDFIKQLKDPDDDDESEKLEIKYETESFNEMKKHLSSLGFDLNNEIEGRYYFSKKYPDLIIRFIDGDDGVGVIIQPKCTLKTNSRFKLITDKDAKKLNEDYSEVKIDPEMEQLMKLAGITTEDLDDLEDDDLDDVMDESVKSAINNIENAEKEMAFHITQFETFNKAAQKFMQKIEKYPVLVKPSDNPSVSEQMKKDADEFTKIYEKCNTKLTNNATIKYAISTTFDKISYSNELVANKQLDLYLASRAKYADLSIRIMIDINRLLDRVEKYQKSIINKYTADVYNLKISNILENAIKSFISKVYTVTKWCEDIEKYSGRTRTSLFGKKIKDVFKNESVTGAAIIAGLITTGIVAGAIADAKNARDNTIEITDKEFDAKLNSISKISDEIIKSFKSSKYWNLVYEPCMTYKSKDIKSQISKMKDAFNKGKAVRPMIYINLVDLDNFDSKIYTKLDKESEKPYSNPDYEDLWDEVSSKSYYEGIDTLKHTLEKLGFYKNGVSPKYPGLIVTEDGGAEYVGFTVKLSDDKYYKKTSNKSLKESVVEDYMYDLDFMMESFLNDF